jgi:hypothetical protein
MKTSGLFLACFTLFFGMASIGAQATFQNLNFESANLPQIPPGQTGGIVAFSDALPGWVGYLGANLTTNVYHNELSAGSARINIIGPEFPTTAILEGQYTLALQSGGPQEPSVEASIAQIGLLPMDIQAIQVKASGSNFAVSFKGQSIAFSPIGNGPNYTLYQGDVSAFAGQLGELRLSSIAPPNPFTVSLDSISFVSVPEPSSTLFLLTGGTFALVTSFRRRGFSP